MADARQVQHAIPKDALPSEAPVARAVQAPPEQTRYQFDPLVPSWALAALAGLMLAGIWRSYARTTRALPASRKLALAGIRAAGVAVLMFCMARPVMVRNTELQEKGVCFVALDTSSSMNFRDAAAGRTRWESANAMIASHKPHLEMLAANFELQRYVFDAAARRTPKLPGEPGTAQSPAGTTTNLTAILETLVAEGAGISTAGALIISDGRHNAAQDPVPAAMALGRAGLPLYIIGLGQDATPVDYRDIRVKQLIVPEKAFIGGRMRIGVEIESTLPSRQSVPLVIEVNGKPIFNQKIDLPTGPNVPHPIIDVPYTPEVLGVHRVVATLGGVPLEANLANNSAMAFFRVFRTRIGIWYVEGAVRKEFGAIRSALETAPNVNLNAMNAFVAQSSSREDLLPSTEQEWAQQRLIIIGDLAAARFDGRGLERLAKFVEDGGSVLLIGGMSTLGPGGWQSSPLSRALPVDVTTEDGMLDGPLPMEVNAEEANHPIVKLEETPERSLELWKRLPPVPGVNKIAGVRPAARVLLKAGTRELLVVQEYGKGRSAVFTGDMTWQWGLKANQGDTHKAFWRTLATWLTRSDYRDTNKAVYADSDRLHYFVGDDAQFGAHVHETEKTANLIKEARVAITLSKLEGQTETVVLQENAGKGPGEFMRRFSLGSPGNYRFKAAAFSPQGNLIDSDSLDLHVSAPDVESDNPKANLRLLRRLAALSGGVYFDPENASKAFAALFKEQAVYSKPVTEVSELWSSAWVLAIFVLLLSSEWFFRRRWGLI